MVGIKPNGIRMHEIMSDGTNNLFSNQIYYCLIVWTSGRRHHIVCEISADISE
jgi:hypothetical protein